MPEQIVDRSGETCFEDRSGETVFLDRAGDIADCGLVPEEPTAATGYAGFILMGQICT